LLEVVVVSGAGVLSLFVVGVAPSADDLEETAQLGSAGLQLLRSVSRLAVRKHRSELNEIFLEEVDGGEPVAEGEVSEGVFNLHGLFGETIGSMVAIVIVILEVLLESLHEVVEPHIVLAKLAEVSSVRGADSAGAGDNHLLG
jgi:hypothetical protein